MMKIAIIAVIWILISVMGSVIYRANIFGDSGGAGYYEPRYTERYTEIQGRNISSFSEEQQFTQSMNLFDVLLGSLTADWLVRLIPRNDLQEALGPFITGINAFFIFLGSIAILEIVFKRPNILG